MTIRTAHAAGSSPSFKTLLPSDLDEISVYLQCLDNQWIPQTTLTNLLQHQRSRHAYETELATAVRAEYIRGLINSRQVVINRAYLKNNRQVYRDYLYDGSTRLVFKQFLNDGVVVPFLVKERSPTEDADFTTDAVGARAWADMCKETFPHCVRLSWDDAENDRLVNDHLFGRTVDFAQKIQRLNPKETLHVLRGTPSSDLEIPDFRQRLLDVRNFVNSLEDLGPLDATGAPIFRTTRTHIYEHFVCTDGSPIDEGWYDAQKPFSREIKLLFDLIYNTNPSDALGIHALTPFDTPSRTAILTWEAASLKHASDETLCEEELAKLLTRQKFAAAQELLNFPSFYDVDLADVLALRNTDTWQNYIVTLQHLLNSSLSQIAETDALRSVYVQYVKTLAQLSQVRAKRRALRTEHAWSQSIEFVVVVAIAGFGSALARIIPADDGVWYEFLDGFARPLARRAGTVIIKACIRGYEGAKEAGKLADLGSNLVIKRGRFEDAATQFHEFKRLIEREFPSHDISMRKREAQAEYNQDE